MSMLSRLLRRDADGELTVEPLRRRHLAGVMAIESVSYPKPWTQNLFQSELELVRAGERHYIVARVNNEVVGYAGMMFVVGDAHVTNIAVAADRQRCGIATRLLATLSWDAIGRGCEAITLEVRTSRCAAALLREHRRRNRHVATRHRRT
jgi:[ribosomal protein S18]-alanine N-acetyltransferase